MQHTTIIDAIAANPDAHKPPVFGALLAARMDEGKAYVSDWGTSIVIGKKGEPAIATGDLPANPFGHIVDVLDQAHGRKINRLGKPTIVGPVEVSLQHTGQRKGKVYLAWHGTPTAHERLAFLRSLAPLDGLGMAWL